MNLSYRKYRNYKCKYKGIKFDSKKELEYYLVLYDRLKHDEIEDLKRQVKFELQPKFKINGKKIRPIYYIADFTYIEEGKLKVVDKKWIKVQ